MHVQIISNIIGFQNQKEASFIIMLMQMCWNNSNIDEKYYFCVGTVISIICELNI